MENKPDYKGPNYPLVDSFYFTHHKSRGKAVIFNHSVYEMNIKSREGSEEDVKNLTSALLTLGFKENEILVLENLKVFQILKELEKVQQEDHTDRDLLMVFVLTHGFSDQILAYDQEYSVKNLWGPFTAEKCKTLVGKPKIFFVVACRGDMEDPGYQTESFPTTEKDSRPFAPCEYTYSIPNWADFLCVYSTFEGYVSYREKDKGTWYIKAFCDQLKEVKIHQWTFLDFLISVNQRIALSYYSVPDRKKQIPMFSSTLTKTLVLTPKILYRESDL